MSEMRESVLQVSLSNGAPAGLPPYVDVRLDDPLAPPGSNKTLVQVYGPVGSELRTVYAGDTVPAFARASEAGRPVWVAQVELLRGESVDVSFVYAESSVDVPDKAVVVSATAIPSTVSVNEVLSNEACSELPPTIPEVNAAVGGAAA